MPVSASRVIWPNLLKPATDILSYLAGFVDSNGLLFFTSVSRDWRRAWGYQRPTATAVLTANTSVSQLLCSVKCGLDRTAAVCGSIAELGKLDLLECAKENGFPWDETTSSSAG